MADPNNHQPLVPRSNYNQFRKVPIKYPPNKSPAPTPPSVPIPVRQFYQTTAKVIPYYIDDNKIMILLTHSYDWHDWSALGGTCSKFENHIRCIIRELDEESQHLLKINLGQCNLKNCAKLNYQLPTLHTHHKTRTQFDTFIYFVKCQDPEATVKLVDKFNEKDRQEEFRTANKHKKSVLEMSQLQFVDLNGDVFANYFINTLKEYEDRIQHHQDELLHQYTDQILSHVLKEVNQVHQSTDTDHKRFDIKFLAGVIDGITQVYKTRKWDPPLTIEEVITGLNALLLEPGCECTLSA